jgi:hypothetical protein
MIIPAARKITHVACKMLILLLLFDTIVIKFYKILWNKMILFVGYINQVNVTDASPHDDPQNQESYEMA